MALVASVVVPFDSVVVPFDSVVVPFDSVVVPFDSVVVVPFILGWCNVNLDFSKKKFPVHMY